jgi:hypothetical protein
LQESKLMELACKHASAWIKIGFAVSMAQALHMMREPSKSLSWSAQEERRRTLWSIYLLDKMATCGRGRPSLFLDQTCQVQLPCSENSFQTSIPETVITLEEFKRLDDYQATNADSFARTIAVASTLSQVAAYTFQQNGNADQKPPWDHTSEYLIICSQLTRFEALFDCFQPIQERIMIGFLPRPDGSAPLSESFIFSYVLYHLCHCLLQHPFMLRQRLELFGKRIPPSFFAGAIESCWSHAQELSQTIANAKEAGYKVAATMFNYSMLVTGTIYCLFQHAADDMIRTKSRNALLYSLTHLHTTAQYWKNSAYMVCNLCATLP